MRKRLYEDVAECGYDAYKCKFMAKILIETDLLIVTKTLFN